MLQVKVQVKRHKIEELPETADGIAQWCKDAFVAKVLQVIYKIKAEFLKRIQCINASNMFNIKYYKWPFVQISLMHWLINV